MHNICANIYIKRETKYVTLIQKSETAIEHKGTDRKRQINARKYNSERDRASII